jgi:hypothetical protein
MSGWLRRILPLLVTLCLGCAEGPAPTAVQGTVTELESGAPVAGATIFLFEASTLTPGSGLARTDARGHYRLEDLISGDYVLVLICEDSFIAYDRAKPLVHVEAGSVTAYDLAILGRLPLGGPRYRIDGTVTDAATGTPVAGAFVEPSLWALSAQDLHGAIAGVTVPDWGTTDAHGQFSIRAFVTSDETGTHDGLAPITVLRAGYEPFTLVGSGRVIPFIGPLLPLPADSVLTVTIRLRPAGAARGGIRGRVVERGTRRPAAGIRVGLSVMTSAHPDTLGARRPAPVPVQGKVAVTDSSGAFLIEGLSPASYVIAPAYLEDDGYAGGSPWLRAREVEIGDADTAAVDAGDVEVLRAVRPLYPAQRSTIRDPAPELRWEPFPAGTGYEVIGYLLEVNTGFFGEPIEQRLTGEPRWQAPAFAPGTRVSWWVSVLAAVGAPPDTVKIGSFERGASFMVASP